MARTLSAAALALFILCPSPPPAAAEQFRYGNLGAKTLKLAGAFAGVTDDQGGLYTSSEGECCYPVVFDTGASSLVMSKFVANNLGVATVPGVTYEDFGIGGFETFDVTQPTQLFLAPIATPEGARDTLDPLNPAPYASFGTFNMQVRQDDPTITLLGIEIEDVVIDIVGTPVLNNYVLHVHPNTTSFNFGGLAYSVDVMETELLTSLPGDVPAEHALRVPLVYQNFVDMSQGPPPVDTAENPVVPGVHVNDSRGNLAPSNWLLDMGGASNLASRAWLGGIVDYGTETPVDIIQAIGVGDSVVEMEGYRVDEIVVPVLGGHEIVIEDQLIYVPPAGQDFPAGTLTGVLGVNNWSPSFDAADASDERSSPFDDWYVDPVNNQFVLVDPLIVVPEPHAWLLAAVGLSIIGVVAALRRQKDAGR